MDEDANEEVFVDVDCNRRPLICDNRRPADNSPVLADIRTRKEDIETGRLLLAVFLVRGEQLVR